MTQKSLDKNYWSELPEMTELKNGPEKTRSSWVGLFTLKLTCWKDPKTELTSNDHKTTQNDFHMKFSS